MLPIIDTQSQRWIKKRDKKIFWFYEQGANTNRIKSYLNRWTRWATVLVFLGIPVHSVGASCRPKGGECVPAGLYITQVNPSLLSMSIEQICLWQMNGDFFPVSDSCSIIATEAEPSSDMSLPPVTTTSSGNGSTYTAPTQPEEEKVISEPIVVERQTGNAEQTGTKPELDNVTKLYIATFGRAPESAGSVYWLYESKLNLEDIVRSFFDQEETKEKYPEGFSNYDFIVAIYNHVYDRDPDQEGGDYWLEELESGKVEKGLFILAVINGAIGDDALMLEKQTIAGVDFVKSGIQNLDMAKKVIDDLKL